MVVVNYDEFKDKLNESLDQVCDDKETVIVSRSQNKNVVIISLDEYNSWQETKYLLSSETNRQRLTDAVKDVESGKYEQHDLIED